MELNISAECKATRIVNISLFVTRSTILKRSLKRIDIITHCFDRKDRYMYLSEVHVIRTYTSIVHHSDIVVPSYIIFHLRRKLVTTRNHTFDINLFTIRVTP